MKRSTPLRRTGGLRRTGPPKRKTSLRAVNSSRRAERFERDFGSAERLAWVQALPCATCPAGPPCQASHVRSRGAGGSADDVIPQCVRCHAELHQVGRRTFEARHGVELAARAAETARTWVSWAVRDEAPLLP